MLVALLVHRAHRIGSGRNTYGRRGLVGLADSYWSGYIVTKYYSTVFNYIIDIIVLLLFVATCFNF